MRQNGSIGQSVTINDVAAATGVSIRTVSRVLNKSDKVGHETRMAIEKAIERLGFRPNTRARALASGRSYLLGVIQDDPNAHVIGEFQRGIVEVCSQAGYELLVHPVRVGDPALVDGIADFVMRSRVDGLVLLPPVAESADLARALAGLRVPAVAIAALRVPGYPSMLVSAERAAARAMADHLVALGHRRIGMITGPQGYLSSRERAGGFRDALADHGIAMSPALVREGDYGYERGIAAAEELLGLDERPTAIFASNDIMAAATLKVALGSGLSVPADLSIAGFDDSDLSSMMTPAMTTIRRPIASMARDATRRLVAMLDSDRAEAPDDGTVELTLLARQSTGPAPRPGSE